MDNKTQPLWDGSQEPPKGLRPPNTSLSRLLEETKTSANSEQKAKDVSKSDMPPVKHEESKVVNSRLSAEAPEFYPSYFKNQQPSIQSSIQDRLKKHKVNESNASQQDEFDDFIGSPDDIRLNHLINTLTKDPGQFSDLFDIFMDTLCPYFEDVLMLTRAAQLLVKQVHIFFNSLSVMRNGVQVVAFALKNFPIIAIMHPSFRYSAARLCCYIEDSCPQFRAALHLTCQKELQDNPNKSGLLLFVAELYTQLHHENIYGNYLIDAFKQLLTTGGNENIKCICQALKLTGYSLELYNKKAMDEVFAKLIEVQPTASGTALSLINSVVALRNSQWGQGSPQNSSSNSEVEVNYWGDTSHTVFYGSDGSKLTSEENDFLAANLNATDEYYADLSDPDELCDPEPEMDEEIQAAFKDFVKLSKR